MKSPALIRSRESALDEQFDAEWSVNASVGEDEDFEPNKKKIRQHERPDGASPSRGNTLFNNSGAIFAFGRDLVLQTPLPCRSHIAMPRGAAPDAASSIRQAAGAPIRHGCTVTSANAARRQSIQLHADAFGAVEQSSQVKAGQGIVGMKPDKCGESRHRGRVTGLELCKRRCIIGY
jgi:hypothetical protein